MDSGHEWDLETGVKDPFSFQTMDEESVSGGRDTLCMVPSTGSETKHSLPCLLHSAVVSYLTRRESEPQVMDDVQVIDGLDQHQTLIENFVSFTGKC